MENFIVHFYKCQEYVIIIYFKITVAYNKRNFTVVPFKLATFIY